MKNAGWAGMLAAMLTLGAATVNAGKEPVYILKGYSFGRMPGVNTTELEAKLKDKAGAHITRANILADKEIIAKELEARHINGVLFAGVAERNGHIWVIFDLQHPQQLPGADKRPRHLETQSFEGATRISPVALAAATGLKKGDIISPEKLNAARQAILRRYAKALPGKAISLKSKMRTKPDGAATMTWIIGEPK
jgi:hypothetical protein